MLQRLRLLLQRLPVPLLLPVLLQFSWDVEERGACSEAAKPTTGENAWNAARCCSSCDFAVFPCVAEGC